MKFSLNYKHLKSPTKNCFIWAKKNKFFACRAEMGLILTSFYNFNVFKLSVSFFDIIRKKIFLFALVN